MTGETNQLLPVFINGAGLRALVVGGGEVAVGKVLQLRQCQFDVSVVSPQLNARLRALQKQGEVLWHRRPYRQGDLAEVDLVICATDDPKLQGEISEAARARHLLVNVVDAPHSCTFYMGAVASRGNIKIAVSTNGQSPALARRIRDELDGAIAPEYEALLEILGEIRPQVQERLHESFAQRRKFFEAVLATDCLELLRRGERLIASKRVAELLDEAAD